MPSNRPPTRIEPLRQDSWRAAAQAIGSPRVWKVVALISGWAAAGGVYVAGSARQTDVTTLQTDARAAAAALELAATHATEAGRRALATQEAAALAYRALVGQCARAKGGNAKARDAEQAAAELRYDRAMAEGTSPAAAIRSALQ